MTTVNVTAYFRSEINKLTAEDFAKYNPSANGIADDMAMMIVRHPEISNDEGEDLINSHFDDFVVMLYQRAAALGVKFRNRMPANEKLKYECEFARRSEYQ